MYTRGQILEFNNFHDLKNALMQQKSQMLSVTIILVTGGEVKGWLPTGIRFLFSCFPEQDRACSDFMEMALPSCLLDQRGAVPEY